jgi:hypothetical protein
MIAFTAEFEFTDVLLLLAILLFVLSCVAQVAKGWMLAIGLALLAASFLTFVK